MAFVVGATRQVHLPVIPKELMATLPKPLIEAPASAIDSVGEHHKSLFSLAELARAQPEAAKAVGGGSPPASSFPAPAKPEANPLGGFGVAVPHQDEPPLVKLPPAQAAAKPKTRVEAAIDAVVEEVETKSAEIQKEEQWVKDVEEIVDVYGKKLEAVKEHVNDMRLEVKALYKKKKQLENLSAQKGLEDKLGDAHDDLQMLQAALSHVKARAEEFSKIRGEVQKTIEASKSKLAALNGPAKPVPTL
jgi:prefoldin subunit 5